MTSKERARLKGLAANEDTIVQVGKGGITDSVIASVNTALSVRRCPPASLSRAACLRAACSPPARPVRVWPPPAVPNRCRRSATVLSCIKRIPIRSLRKKPERSRQRSRQKSR